MSTIENYQEEPPEINWATHDPPVGPPASLSTVTTNAKRKYMCVKKFISYIYSSISFPTDLVVKSRLAKKEGNPFYESVMMFSIKDCKYLTPYRGLQI